MWVAFFGGGFFFPHLKPLDSHRPLRQRPHGQRCDFEGKGHGVENCHDGERLEWEAAERHSVFGSTLPLAISDDTTPPYMFIKARQGRVRGI